MIKVQKIRNGSPDLDRRRRLYDEGLTDRQIANATGASVNAVTLWRCRAGLPVNAAPILRGERPSAWQDFPERHALHRRGLSDGESARALSIPLDTFSHWRRHRRLPRNFGRASSINMNVPAINPLSNQEYARISATVGRNLPRDIRDDVISEMYVAVLEKRLSLHDVACEARSFVNGVLSAFASRFGPRSIDEDRGGFTISDQLRDERSVHWLEEMGASAW